MLYTRYRIQKPFVCQTLKYKFVCKFYYIFIDYSNVGKRIPAMNTQVDFSFYHVKVREEIT